MGVAGAFQREELCKITFDKDSGIQNLYSKIFTIIGYNGIKISIFFNDCQKYEKLSLENVETVQLEK